MERKQNLSPGSSSATVCQHCGNTSYLEESNLRSARRESGISSKMRFPLAHKGMLARLTVLAFFSFMFAGIYLTFFKHPPPSVLLQMNMKSQESSGLAFNDFGASSFQTGKKLKADVSVVAKIEEDDDVDETLGLHKGVAGADLLKIDEEDEESEEDQHIQTQNKPIVVQPQGGTGAAYWNQFLKVNNYLPIGAVFDKCDEPHEQIGTVVLLEDKELGGVKTITFFNVTFNEEIKGGQFNIDVKYNGNDLYDNYWDLCELEDELPEKNRTFNCPVHAGHWTVAKEKHIPGYLPKGRFTSKCWATDENDKVIGCGFSDFKL